MIKKFVTWSLIFITVGLVIGAIVAHRTPQWEDAPKPLQSGAQPPIGTMEAGCFTPGEVAVECLEAGGARCPYEDGDPSGHPCWWVDPSGGVYYVTSEEYR